MLCTSLMTVIVGNTSLNVALPTLSRALGAPTSQLQWIVDAYSLVFAGILLSAGAIGDRFGRKGALQFGLVVFLGAILVAAFTPNASATIAARAVMGFGAAFVMSAKLSIVTDVFPPAERPKAIAMWSAIAFAGGAFGPVISGFLLEHFWWGSVYLINIPVIAFALIAGYMILPKTRDPVQGKLDPFGAVLSIVGLSSSVAQRMAGVGSAMNDTTRELGGALGVAVLGSIVASRYSSQLRPSLNSLSSATRDVASRSVSAAVNASRTLSGPDGAALAKQARKAYLSGMSLALLLAAVIVFTASVFVYRLLPHDAR